MTEQFANNASSTLNGAINNSTTTIVVTSATPFPSVGNFRLLLGVSSLTAEIVLVTNVSGTTFTVVRGQEGTTASSWADLTTVTHIVTAGAVEAVRANLRRDKPLHSSLDTIGSTQDGYALTWINGDGYWAARPGTTTSVQNGKNYSSTFDIDFFPNITSTASTTFVNSGSFEFDPTILTSANGTRTISLRVIGETTGPLLTIQLFNYTTASVVTGSTLTTSSVVPVLLTTGDLTANLTNGPAIYQVQIKIASGGTASDRVSLDMAKLRIVWS